MDIIRKHIKSDEVNKTINTEKQARHIRGRDGYIKGRSYLIDNIDAQELVNKFHGTGKPGIAKNSTWNHKETIATDKIIGIVIDQNTKIEIPTTRFRIHYSKTGTHIVPTLRE